MANCKSCGTALREGARFCAQCGAAVEKDIVCAQCGEKLEAGDRFCIACGAAVKSAEVPAAKPAPIPAAADEYPAWQSFAALWDARSIFSVGAGSPEGHYLSTEYGRELFRVDAEGVKAERIGLPEGVLAFCGKLWKNGRLWLSAMVDCGGNTARVYRLYTYTPAGGFSVALDISGKEYGEMERFIVTEEKIFLFAYNSRRMADKVSLMVCGHDGSGLRELWRGEDFILRGAGRSSLYMVCQDSKCKRGVLIIDAGGTVTPAADALGAQLPLMAAGLGVELGESPEERGDFCWKYIPFIDFSEGVIYAALDDGGTENLTRRVYRTGLYDGGAGGLQHYGGKWLLGDIDPTENFREYFDGSRAVGFTYGPPGRWTALHADGRRVDLGEGNYWDGGAVLGDYFYLDCRGSEPGVWYKISLKDGGRRKIEF